MKLIKAYKFRLYPTKDQLVLLKQHAGNTRWLWNQFLSLNQKQYESSGKFVFGTDLINSIPSLKQGNDWLSASIAQSLQQVGRRFDRALRDCIKKKKGFPQFKKKSDSKDSFTVPQYFKINRTSVYIPKIGEVKWVKHQPIKGIVKQITIKQDGDQWFCSVCVSIQRKQQPIKEPKNIVGIDVGIKTYATLSDSSAIENPKILKKHEKRLAKEQQILSRKQKGSKNRDKQRIKVQRIYRKIRNIRKDFQHQTTHQMTTKYDGFVVENLNIQGMLKNKNYSKSVLDCGWYEFKKMLKYKNEWNNKIFIEIDQYDPSSKTCSECGWYNPDLTINDREFVCRECGIIIDRDLNASINIKKFGLKRLGFSSGEVSAERLPWDTRELNKKPAQNQEKECVRFNGGTH